MQTSNNNTQKPTQPDAGGRVNRVVPQIVTARTPRVPEIAIVEANLRQHFLFRKNVVVNATEVKKTDEPGSAFKRVNIDNIYRHIQHTGLANFNLQKLNSLLNSDFVPEYDPFVSYFEGLHAWDEVDHIAKLAGYVTTDDQEFFVTMFKKALVRSIACALPPHKENRIVMVLVQEAQNKGKSSFLRFLNPFGTEYYTESPLQNNKDTEFRFAENFIYNLEELSSLTNMEVNRLKAMISKSTIKERKPYSINEEVHPRRCNFWGSTNKTQFLTDDQNTRWLCFNVENIDWGYSKEINIHKVWAQAYHLFKAGYDYQLTAEESGHRDERNRDYELSSLERELLMEHFVPCKKDATHSVFYSITEVEKELYKQEADNPVRLNRYALQTALKQLGFERGRIRMKGHSAGKRGYYMIAQWVESANLPEIKPRIIPFDKDVSDLDEAFKLL